MGPNTAIHTSIRATEATTAEKGGLGEQEEEVADAEGENRTYYRAINKYFRLFLRLRDPWAASIP